MLSFFVELLSDIYGSDHRGQFLFLGAKLHRFPHRRIIFSPFSQPKRQNIDARQTSDLNQDAPSGHYINGYNWLMILLCRFSSYGFSLRAIGLLAVSDMPFLSN